ncbi:hypothetical protein LTR37_012456 [Vermiconidia calcicola]|uniref:Uncharacterized protein n=1 Tax=Vermiconidia calcicola TaxID=1690605 RepID=A0ACC3MZM6_9PEZI|nr:hypothetical protein LTR37_012456 [Vermiconidia calcicola]
MSPYRFSSMRAPTLRTSPIVRSIAVQRSFQSCRVLAVGKESAVHEEGRAENVEAEKQEQVKKARSGKGEWHEGLASDSESIVKADRSEMGNTEQTIKELQQETAKQAEKESKGQ